MFRRSCTRAGELLEEDQRWLIIATAAIGALLGSRILGLMEQVFISISPGAPSFCPGAGLPSAVYWAAGLPWA